MKRAEFNLDSRHVSNCANRSGARLDLDNCHFANAIADGQTLQFDGIALPNSLGRHRAFQDDEERIGGIAFPEQIFVCCHINLCRTLQQPLQRSRRDATKDGQTAKQLAQVILARHRQLLTFVS